MKTYKIGDKEYVQKPVVFGQLRQLLGLLDGLALPLDSSPLSIVAAFGDRLPTAIGIVLQEDGVRLIEKDPVELGRRIEFDLTPEQTVEIIEDFFDCNPVAELGLKLSGMIQSVKGKVKMPTPTGSTK